MPQVSSNRAPTRCPGWGRCPPRRQEAEVQRRLESLSSEPRWRSYSPRAHEWQENKLNDVVGLEGSCQEAIPLPSTTFDMFFVVFRSAHTTPHGHLRRIRVFIPVASAPMRRTSHPSGSRPLDVSLPGQTSAPGIVNAPENPRFPAVSKRVQRTDTWLPRGATFDRAHGRGVA